MRTPVDDRPARSHLTEGWVIANHILVSFHVAFISSVIALPASDLSKSEVLRFVFVSPETLLSAALMYTSFHLGIALHEIGHFLAAVRLNAMDETILAHAQQRMGGSVLRRWAYYLSLLLRAPYGRALGIKREGLNYYPDAPYNLAVAAAGPRASRNVAAIALPPAIALLAVGLMFESTAALIVGRLLLGVGVVTLLDFLLADPGKYAEYRRREGEAEQKARGVEALSDWRLQAKLALEQLTDSRMQRVMHPALGPVCAPWQFRNCGMGGRHTEKEYPESNISMQEAMFLIRGARDYLEAQEITVRLQNRLKQIIESEQGCRVMGIGLEGGLAPYIERGEFALPELRLWSLMKRAIAECGLTPGRDVAIALDPALSELEIAFRKEHDIPDAVGTYLFWRDKAKVVLDRDAVLDVYRAAIEQHEIPLLSIEDAFAEDDHEGFKLLTDALGDSLLVVGDDLVTTNDQTIEQAADAGLINCALIKANQIGTLSETLLAMLVALGKGLELIISHRSKSPNDDMEAQIALAINALGLKAGGGSNTERLVKYQAVTELMLKAGDAVDPSAVARAASAARIRKLRAYEEPTNAGIPTVGVTADLAVSVDGDTAGGASGGAMGGVPLRFRGATPLGTSAGTGEAIHLVDEVIEYAEHREVIDRFAALFEQVELGVYKFAKGVDDGRVRACDDERLSALYQRAVRYGGKGCLNAVDNVLQVIAPHFEGRCLGELSLRDIDRTLLSLELATARRRGKVVGDGQVAAMQRKANLGMNAVLSTSLALARGLAHIQGKELYELLREELFALIDLLARRTDVQLRGSGPDDYIDALRRACAALSEDGTPIYQALRELSEIYVDTASDAAQADRRTPAQRAAAHDDKHAAAAAGHPYRRGQARSPRPADDKPSPPAEQAAPALPRKRRASVPVDRLALGDEAGTQLDAVERVLHGAYVAKTGDPKRALRQYLDVKPTISRSTRLFGIVNNRIFVNAERGRLLVPYLIGTDVLLRESDGNELLRQRHVRFARGTIFTDALLCGELEFVGECVDLLPALHALDDAVAAPSINRIRDIAAVLRRVNQSTNRNEAVYLLRHLVARLYNLSASELARAKNLQPEVADLTSELATFVDSPVARRLALLTRLLVRNMSTLAGKPRLIDRLWNDAITLAEVQVRGSSIANELRRSCHHALGDRTLELAHAYRTYLTTGKTAQLSALGFSSVAAADERARDDGQAVALVERFTADLERLLGTEGIAERIDDARQQLADALVRCEFGRSIDDELTKLREDGIGKANRWIYQHHLRLLLDKARSFDRPRDAIDALVAAVEALQKHSPGDDGFDAARVVASLDEATATFVAAVRAEYKEPIFTAIDKVFALYGRDDMQGTFAEVCALRHDLAARIERGGFSGLRYHLHQIDCLLEELGYLALGQLATTLSDTNADLERCLWVIGSCVKSLQLDGLQSQELSDLAQMLQDAPRSDVELLDILEALERGYHRTRQRVTVPFDRMRERLGLGERETLAMLANMQRTMHDLNSMVHFSNIARTTLTARADGTASANADAATRPPRREASPWDVLHLSHRPLIDERVRQARSGDACTLREQYGGKGSGLLYISQLNIPTRDGFILPTSLPRSGRHRDEQALAGCLAEHVEQLRRDIERRDGVLKQLSGVTNNSHPLLLAVRGGSVFSMPGILHTVVFVGMCDAMAELLAERDPWCAYDSYRRFIASYAAAVFGVDLDRRGLVEEHKKRHGVAQKRELPWESMRDIAKAYRTMLREEGFGDELERALADPMHQLTRSVLAVLGSWDSSTARRYRDIKRISSGWQTACIVQEMSFGNWANDDIRPGMDETRASLTGVVPRTVANEFGVRRLTGEFKFSAAGDDLVGGTVASRSLRTLDELATLMPRLHARLRHVVAKLRRRMGSDQEIEFTVEHGVLSVLQARAAATSAQARAERFVEPGAPSARGLGICGGCLRGLVAFDEADLAELSALDLSARDDVDGVVMLLENPTPDDIPTIISAAGLVTARGGSTSHAAVAANAIEDRTFSGVMSAAGLHVDVERHEATIVDEAGVVTHRIGRGDVLSIDGTSGEIYVGSRVVTAL